MTTDSDLAAACSEFGVEAVDEVLALRRDAAVLSIVPTSDRRSHYGGRPCLPDGVEWPRWRGRSQSFIAQIDLGELGPVPGLPREGTLLFFYDAQESTWGFDPADRGSAVVLHAPTGEASTVHDWPADLPAERRYEARTIESTLATTLPPWESAAVEALRLSREQVSAYMDLAASMFDDEVWASRGLVGGHPDQIQCDMTAECALVTGGLDVGDGNAYEHPRAPELLEGAGEWRLLLQVPSIEEIGMEWGDMGCLYYWIREQDLLDQRFDRTWLILQCY